jgi:hypothetical protein
MMPREKGVVKPDTLEVAQRAQEIDREITDFMVQEAGRSSCLVTILSSVGQYNIVWNKKYK